MASAANASNTTGLALGLAGGLTALGLLTWADKAVPQAGLWALLLLSTTVGFVHGALDAVLLPQQVNDRVRLAAIFAAYLLVVVLLGWALSAAVSVALWVLLIMSAWHFGEPFGRWSGLRVLPDTLTRTVVGGAPVMLPVWLAADQLALILQGVVPAIAMQGWRALAWVWLALLIVWLGLCGVAHPRALRYAWWEVLATVLLYLVFSPLMAFAIYFGIYHAPAHIWRVWCSFKRTAKMPQPKWLVVAAVLLTTVATWLLGAGLWWFLGLTALAATDWAFALRWLIIAFAALTAPHLVLISYCASFLSKRAVV